MLRMPFDFFSKLEYLEPRCPSCGSALDFGVNTRFDDSTGSNVCNRCNSVLKNVHEEQRPSLKITDFDVA